jgi:hydrogenase-1 operon protein HyaF
MTEGNGLHAGALTPRVRALLAEIAQLVDGLARNGGDARVDLRSPPLSDGDRAALEAALGRGAVSARVDAARTTDVRETHFPGVWWVTHREEHAAVVAEFIEVCVVPEILATPAEDIARGLAELRARTAADGAWAGRPPPG